MEYTELRLELGRSKPTTLELRQQQLRTAGAEAELQLAEQRFRALVEHSSDCVDVVDADGRILWISPACIKILDFTPDELVGKPAFDLIDPVHVSSAIETLRKCIETKAAIRSELRVRHKSGDWIDVEVITCSHLENPAIRGIVCNFREISERKRAEEALQRDERHLRSLFDRALDGIVVLDCDHRVVDVNVAACEMFGKTKPELLTVRLADLVEYRSDGAWFQQQLNSSRTFRSEISVLASDGSRKILDASVTSNFLPGKHLLFFRDVTEQRQLEDNLRRASKLEAIGRLAGGVAHDFNNLLMVIASYAELANDISEQNSEVHGFLSEIQKATHRASCLTQQLLAFSRKQVLSPTVVDVNEVLADEGEMLSRVIGEDIKLTMDLATDLKPIVADRTQLQQVIINLTVNARDAMPNGGTFRIQTRNESFDDMQHGQAEPVRPPRGEYVLIEVHDDGDGIPEEIQGKVFEPFLTTKPNGLGTGLGLATVYGIVKQSGGFIWLKSQVGQGTVFTIYFPISKHLPPHQSRAVVGAAHQTGTDSILLVEDEEQMLGAVSNYLKARGYRVHEANGADEALEIARQESQIDILITDVIMPGMNGRMLAGEFSKIHREAKVIYMTGYTDPVWAHKNDISYRQSLLRKPFKLDTLVQMIHSIRTK